MCRTQTRKYVLRLYEQDELYDLVADPGEQVNRIGDPAYAEDARDPVSYTHLRAHETT